jgi:amino acid adenylation domain-containing protein
LIRIDPLLHDTVRRWADERGGHPAIAAKDVVLDYRQLWEHATRLANALIARGVRRRDRVAIFMDNVPECAFSLLGIWLADAIAVPVNAQTKSEKLQWILDHSQAVGLLSESHLAPVFEPAVTGRELRVVFASKGEGDPPPFADPLADVLANAEVQPPRCRNIPLDVAAILYTSGTTGEPKGVTHTHQSLGFARDSVADYLELEPTDRVLCTLPLSFGYGLFQFLPATRVGATVVLERNFTYPAAVFHRMENEAVTTFAGVPTTFAMMLAHDAKRPLRFPSVRLVTNAGAALPEEFIPGILRMFPNAGLVKMYGQTECIRACYLPSTMAADYPGSVGIAIPGSELLLLDEDGNEVRAGETGTLHVRGPHVMRGYWNDPDRTNDALVPGPTPAETMLRTGDHFRRDQDDLLYFVSRRDDIIKSRGEKVSPTEVENVIYRLPNVAEAIVLGIPDPILGQAVCALVVPKAGATVHESDVKRACRSVLESYMVPTRVLVVDGLPRTSRGKLSRKLVMEHFRDLLVSPSTHHTPSQEATS